MSDIIIIPLFGILVVLVMIVWSLGYINNNLDDIEQAIKNATKQIQQEYPTFYEDNNRIFL